MKLVYFLAVAVGVQAVAVPKFLGRRGTGITGRNIFSTMSLLFLTLIKSMGTAVPMSAASLA